MNNLIFSNPAIGDIDLINDDYVRLTSITGVSAQSVINTQSVAGLDGSTENQSYVPERPITVNFRIRSGVDAEQAMHDMYRIFAARSHGTMTFVGRLGSSTIDYIVQSCEIPPNQKPPMNGTAMLICTDPYFKALEGKSQIIAGSESVFKFPFTFPDTAFFISRRFPSVFADIINDGEADTECTITFTANAQVVNPTLIDVATGDTAKLNFTMLAGDVITITTGKNNKKILLTRGREVTNIFKYSIYPFRFFTLAQGKNTFKYAADSGVYDLDITMSWTAKYNAMYTNCPAAIDVRIPNKVIEDKLEEIAYIVRRDGLND